MPSEFNIPACKNWRTDFEVLHVGESSGFVYVGADFPMMPVRTPSTEIARSIVEDYVNSKLAVGPEAYPGLVVLPGELTKQEILEDYPEQLEKIREVQANWFMKLVELADDDWNKTHQHKMVTNDQRYACAAIGLKRDWLVEIPKEVSLTICPACMKEFPSGAIVCMNCRFIVDPIRFETMKDQFAVQ